MMMWTSTRRQRKNIHQQSTIFSFIGLFPSLLVLLLLSSSSLSGSSRFGVFVDAIDGHDIQKILQSEQKHAIKNQWIVVLKDEEIHKQLAYHYNHHTTPTTKQEQMNIIIDYLTTQFPNGTIQKLKSYSYSIFAFTAKMSKETAMLVSTYPQIDFIEQDAHVSTARGFIGNGGDDGGAGTERGGSDSVPWNLDRIDNRDAPNSIASFFTKNKNKYKPKYSKTNGKGVTAYILDTGIRIQHREFNGRAKWGTNTIDDQDFDCDGHGTHVAGIVGGKTYGVAKDVDLVAVKIFGCSGIGTWSNIIEGIDWVMKDAVGKVAVANMSLGGEKYEAINKAVRNLSKSGVTVVAAAGNESDDACLYSPSSESSVITVASSRKFDILSQFSNTGECVDIIAPGTSIKSAYIENNKDVETMNGTSMASPHVAGAVALMLSANTKYSPQIVKKKLLSSATKDKISLLEDTGTPNLLLYVGKDDEGVTKEPTRAPTRPPMPTPAPSKKVPSNGGGVCAESKESLITVTLNGKNKTKTCEWLQSRKGMKAKKKICNKSKEVQNVCILTCEKWKKFLHNEELRSCQWLSKMDQSEINGICDDNEDAASTCFATCNSPC